MVEKIYGGIVHTVGPTDKPMFRFLEHDENYLKLIYVDDPDQFIIIDKQSLDAFAKAFKKLAQRYTV